MLELAIQFIAQIAKAFQVLQRAPHTRFGFAAALLVPGYTGGLFNENAQFFGLRFDQARDHALLDNRIAARPEAGAQKDVGDIAAPAFGAVEEILGLSVAVDLAPGGNLGVTGVLPADAAIAVVEHQFDARLAYGFTVHRAVEDHVGHGFAAQVPGGTLPHDPAHGVDDIGFATAVGADHGGHIAREMHAGGVDEGLEAGEFDRL